MSVYVKIKEFSLCKMRYEKNDCRLSYYRNKYLIYALAQIGSFYGKKYPGSKKESAYSAGIRIVCALMFRRGQYVSKQQIKRLVRPNYKKKHVIKFPMQTENIIKAVTFLIDNEKDILTKCGEMNCFICKNKLLSYKLCRDFLVGELYTCLDNLRASINKNSGAERVLTYLDGFKDNCIHEL